MGLSDPMHSGDVVRRLEQLERRVRELSSGRRLEDASVGARGITMVGSSLTVVDPVLGRVVVKLGVLEDGTTGLTIFDPDTDREVSLSTLAFGLRAAEVSWNEGTNARKWVDLSTFGPSVTVRVGNSRQMTVQLSANLSTNDLDPDILYPGNKLMSFEVSGATYRAPFQSYSLSAPPGIAGAFSRTFLLSGLNPGIHTITCKYSAAGVTDAEDTSPTTARFSGRNLIVQPY